MLICMCGSPLCVKCWSTQRQYALRQNAAALGWPLERIVVIDRNADLVWHEMILDTRNYRRACELIFGRYLDHVTFFETPSHDEWEDLKERAHKLYRQAFEDVILPLPDKTCSTIPS